MKLVKNLKKVWLSGTDSKNGNEIHSNKNVTWNKVGPDFI